MADDSDTPTDDAAETAADAPRPDGERLVVGFDLGGTKMLSYLFDASRTGDPSEKKGGDKKTVGKGSYLKLARARKKTHGQRGRDAGLDRIIATIHESLEEGGRQPDELTAIGIGCPGPIDMDDGVLLDPPNLPWGRTEVRKALHKEFGCPVSVLNDVDAGVFGEYRFGAGRKSRCLVGIFPGTGVGGGCVYQGAVFRGATSSVMEVGHVRVDPEGPLCGCGERGCLEAVASRLAIAANSAKAAYRGEAPHLFENAGADLKEIRSGAISDAVEAGDAAVVAIVDEAARQIGFAAAGLIHTIGPDVIVLGGGLVEALPDQITKIVEKTAREHVMKAYQKSFEVRVAQLGDDAGALGAAAWAMKQIADEAAENAQIELEKKLVRQLEKHIESESESGTDD